MAQKKIAFTVNRKLDDFLKRMEQESGMDRANLMRMRVIAWMEEERRLSIAEQQLAIEMAGRQKESRG